MLPPVSLLDAGPMLKERAAKLADGCAVKDVNMNVLRVTLTAHLRSVRAHNRNHFRAEKESRLCYFVHLAQRITIFSIRINC